MVTGSSKEYLSADLPSKTSADGPDGQVPGADRCNITSNGTLRSPNPAVVRTLQPNDKLSVEVASIAGVEVLRAKDSNHINAGVIDCPAEREIVQCMHLGHIYQAVVLRVQGGAVSVVVSKL